MLQRSTVSAAFLCLFLAACSPERPPANWLGQTIVGGTQSPPGFLPAVGALVINIPWYFQAFCTATLVSDRLVLTAAHCLEDLPGGSSIGFFTGIDAYAYGASAAVLPISSYQTHPSYPGGQPPGGLADFYDIAVARLSQPASIAPMRLVRPKEVGPLFKLGSGLLIVGYGQTKASDPNSVGVKHHGTSTLAEVGTSEFWVEGQGEPQKCNGDSGGPTLADADPGAADDWRIIGVASRAGENCTFGSVETRVDVYLSWIHGFGPIPCGSGLSPDCGAPPPPPPPPPKKKIGEACESAADCEGDLCIIADGATVCSASCTPGGTDCPSGYACLPLAAGSGGACVKEAPPPPQKKKALGEACENNDDCATGLCGSSDTTRFCTEVCTPEQGCGEGMDCRPAGDGQFACAPKSAAPQDAPRTGGCSMAHPGATASHTPWLLLFLGAVLWGILLTQSSRTRLP
jgi:hypothetical protein